MNKQEVCNLGKKGPFYSVWSGTGFADVNLIYNRIKIKKKKQNQQKIVLEVRNATGTLH